MTPSNGGTRKHLVSQSSVLSQPDLLRPTELFSQYTVVEVQRNFQKIQRDIESKKRELRTMVGERYRELIDTADTIAEMKSTVKDIRSNLNSIQTSCKMGGVGSQSISTPKSAASNQFTERVSSAENEEEHSKKEEFWSIASQMKLLVDTPEKIWNAMENNNFLIAGQLYLLSRHIVTNLHIGNSPSKHLTKFPVLTQQWGAISHFKPSILQGCRDLLEHIKVSDEQFTDSISTIILLEGVDLCVLVQQVLDKRLGAVRRHLSSGGSVRKQLSDCVESIVCTLNLINNNLVTTHRITEKLQHLCHNVTTMEVVSAAFQQETGLQSLTRHLPTLVHSYHPTVNSSLDIPDIKAMCNTWCDNITQTIHNTLHTTLHYVQSVSSVTNLVKPYCQKSSMEWESVCQSVLDRRVDIWDDILLLPVNDHIKKIIGSYIGDAMLATNKEVSQIILNHEEANVSKFVWNLSCRRESKLKQKTEGFVDSVITLCSNLNERLTAIYNDIITYTGPPEKAKYKEENVRSGDIFSHMCDVTKQSLVHLADHLTAVIPEDADLASRSDEISLLIQICRCLVQYTPQLQVLLTARDRVKYSASSHQLYQCIGSAKRVLLERHGKWLSDVVLDKLAAFLKSEPLSYAVTWEETSIKEETEDGSSVESKISLPIYASSYISTILSALSSELYRVGCHGFEDNEVPTMLGPLNERIVGLYDGWLESAELTQNMALQYWLDFKYITAMCNVATTVNTERNKKVTSVIRRIETNIDPFDWDVFQPSLASNLHGLIRRTYNLYGAVSVHSTTVQAIATSAARAAFQQNTHNILLGNEMVSRFPLLPVRSDNISARHVGTEDEEEEKDTQLQLSSLCRTFAQFSSPSFEFNDEMNGHGI